ncbi:hypothetical protein DFH08DRAFT_942351 [Mycena albidolilacea]|uniref:Uncharacterized protein n=1 Tax=Mycena albidolilacea TaxID=1033008 RepID=A0AAD6ZE87_9AGAR|nr:hypothetical protein DFH08DRAFT_942351 [Mycena albidolilacea]
MPHARPTSAPTMGVPHAAGAPILLTYNHVTEEDDLALCMHPFVQQSRYSNSRTYEVVHFMHLYPIPASALSIVSLPEMSPMPLTAQNHDSQSSRPPRFLCRMTTMQPLENTFICIAHYGSASGHTREDDKESETQGSDGELGNPGETDASAIVPTQTVILLGHVGATIERGLSLKEREAVEEGTGGLYQHDDGDEEKETSGTHGLQRHEEWPMASLSCKRKGMGGRKAAYQSLVKL